MRDRFVEVAVGKLPDEEEPGERSKRAGGPAAGKALTKQELRAPQVGEEGAGRAGCGNPAEPAVGL